MARHLFKRLTRRLEPFVDDTTCIAHVSTTTPFRTTAPKEST